MPSPLSLPNAMGAFEVRPRVTVWPGTPFPVPSTMVTVAVAVLFPSAVIVPWERARLIDAGVLYSVSTALAVLFAAET